MMQKGSQDRGQQTGDALATLQGVSAPNPYRVSPSARVAMTAVASIVGLSLVACAPRFRQEAMGTGTVVVGSDALAAGGGVAVDASPDDIEVAYRIILPRALLLQYAIDCPDESRTGTLGETQEDYSTRRLAELEAERQREVQTKASVVGAVVGRVEGSAAVQTPNASAEVDVAADGAAVGQSIGEQTTPAVQLSPFDTGARTLGDSVRVRGGGSGTCAMRLWSELPGQDLTGVVASYEVFRVVDKRRVAADARRQRKTIALKLRTRVSASLEASGADPAYRAKVARAKAEKAAAARAAALEVERVARAREARLRAEASVEVAVTPPEAPVVVTPPAVTVVVTPPAVAVVVPPPAVDAEAAAAATLAAEEAQRTRLAYDVAIRTRGQLLAWLIANGADPYYRARLRQERFNKREAEKQRRIDAKREAAHRAEISLRFSLQTRETLVAWLVANGADPDYRRKQDEADLAAFTARSKATRDKSRRAAIQAQGTVGISIDSSASVVSSTPPTARPPAVREVRTARPSATAVWIDGFYEWTGGQWVWLAGTWSQPPVQDAIWIPTVEVNLGGRTVIRPGSWRTSAGIRLEGGAAAKRRPKPRVRDHRE